MVVARSKHFLAGENNLRGIHNASATHIFRGSCIRRSPVELYVAITATPFRSKRHGQQSFPAVI